MVSLPGLLAAQVVSPIGAAPRGGHAPLVFGTPLAIEQVLAVCGWTINTAFSERLNLDIRQRVAAWDAA